MSSFSTDAILLKRTEYGDYDLIITYFTRLMGRVSVIAKNAKKSVRRFAGALDPFIAMAIECSMPKRAGSLAVLNSVDIENPFANIRTSTVKTGYASYWIEIINSWMEEGKPDEPLYELIFYVLDSLNTGKVPMEVLSLLFQVRFMRISGFTPNLIGCNQCGLMIDEIDQNMITFDLSAGGLVCDRCRSNGLLLSPFSINEAVENYPINKNLQYRRVYVSKGTLKQLSWMSSTDIRCAERLKFSKNAVKEGETLLEGFIPCHIGRSMKSLNFLHRIRDPFYLKE
ncbi:MAG: DNA repair protein RecO [Desulfamplus sp.]|nr:DNA repair protein RecO [Desulfamplus sp.]